MRYMILGILLLFVMAQVLGVLTGAVLFLEMNANPLVHAFSMPAEPDNMLNAVYFFIYILVGAGFVLFLLRYLRNDLIFVLVEFGLVSSASSIVFYALLRFFLPYAESMPIGIIFGMALAAFNRVSKFFKNPSAIFASAGAGAVFGISLGVTPLFLFIILLAIYDYIAVFKTKHMVEFANYMIKKELSFTVTSRRYVPELKKESRIDLGTGDLIMPIMLEVALLPISPAASLLVFFGALIALALFLFLALKRKMVLPALPPIAAGMIVFFLIGKLAGLY